VDIHLKFLTMNAEASSSSHTTYLHPIDTKRDPKLDQPELDTEGLEVKNSITLLELMTNQSQPQPEPEEITLEAKLAKKDKQLEAARKELCKIEGEKTKLKQEVVSPQPKHKLILGWSR
jgi:hypothetical protein